MPPLTLLAQLRIIPATSRVFSLLERAQQCILLLVLRVIFFGETVAVAPSRWRSRILKTARRILGEAQQLPYGIADELAHAPPSQRCIEREAAQCIPHRRRWACIMGGAQHYDQSMITLEIVPTPVPCWRRGGSAGQAPKSFPSAYSRSFAAHKQQQRTSRPIFGCGRASIVALFSLVLLTCSEEAIPGRLEDSEAHHGTEKERDEVSSSIISIKETIIV